MQCPFCKEEIQEGAIKCKHCGSTLSGSMSSATFDEQQNKNHEATQKAWWRYVPLTDKSIKPIDKGLWIAYAVLAYLIPISAVISLIAINVVRKNNIHGTYKKAANFTTILIALLSFVAGFMRLFK